MHKREYRVKKALREHPWGYPHSGYGGLGLGVHKDSPWPFFWCPVQAHFHAVNQSDDVLRHVSNRQDA